MDEPDVTVNLVLVGTNHRSAPLPVRERLAAHDHGHDLVDHILAAEPVAEAVGLATCNRCELYMVGGSPEAMREAAVRAARGAVRARPRPARADALRPHGRGGRRAPVLGRRGA